MKSVFRAAALCLSVMSLPAYADTIYGISNGNRALSSALGMPGDVIDVPMVKYGLAGLGFWIFLGNLIMRRMIDMRL